MDVLIPMVLSLAALVLAIASAVLAHRRSQDLERRLEAAIRESERLATVVSESTASIEAWVRSSVAESKALEQGTTEETLSEWSAGVVTEVEALFESFRLAVKTDTAALVGQALAEYAGREPQGNESGTR